MDKDLLEKILKSGISVQGDLVLEKHVENEIGNVESYGIGIQIVNGKADDAAKTPDGDAKTPDAIVAELMPIFKNNREETELFVNRIDGLKPTAVTETVNELLRNKTITRSGCKSSMWRILNNYGLYKPSLQNWSAQVNF